jgi:hypothetical protein
LQNGLAVSNDVESVQQQGNVRVGIKWVVAARLYVHVDGPALGGLTVTDLKVAGSASFPAYVSDSDGTVTATVTNSGNLLESPKAHLHATGIFGTLIDRTVQLPQILPGQSIDFSQVWKNMPPFEGEYIGVTGSGFPIGRSCRWRYAGSGDRRTLAPLRRR